MAKSLRIPDYDDAGLAGAYDKRPRTTRDEVRALGRLVREVVPGRVVLDVPCGNGRLAPFLRSLEPGLLLGSDGAPAMLERAREKYDSVLCGDAASLPLADRSVDLVVCVRLLHHFPSRRDRVAILTELARVARGQVIVSYYDVATLQGLRRRVRRGRRAARVAIARSTLLADMSQAGLEPIRFASLLPFVREQTLALAGPIAPSCYNRDTG